MKFESAYIAQWALANEEIPAHLIWDKDEEFDKIFIELPKELKFWQPLGVRKFEYSGSNIIIKRSDLISPNYFGFIVKSTGIFKDVLAVNRIRVTFLLNHDLVGERVLDAKIVRPLIKISDAPAKVVISDNSDFRKLFNIIISHAGLGTAVMEIDMITEGDVISVSNSLYFEIITDIVTDLRQRDTSKKVAELKEFQIEQRFLENMTYQVLKKLDKGEFPTQLADEALSDIKELMKDEIGRERMSRLIYARIRRLLLAVLLYYFERRPNEDIEIPAGKIKALLRPQIRNVSLIIKYKDSIGNEYEPVQHVVEIEDIRTKKIEMFEAPLNIKFQNKPFRAE